VDFGAPLIQPASGHETQVVQIYLNNAAVKEKIKRMPRALKLTSDLSVSIAKNLLEMGANLRLARERRGLSLRALAADINVSVPTIMSMERGEPTVSIGVYAAALSFYGRLDWLPDLMAPEFDREALRIELASIGPRPARRWRA
jgi:DNA-binding XRE family transcriptional regulator